MSIPIIALSFVYQVTITEPAVIYHRSDHDNLYILSPERSTRSLYES